jgi:sugar phosphate isomerase/epimerase
LLIDRFALKTFPMNQPYEIGVMLNNLERDRLRAFAVAARLGFRIVHANALPEAWLSGPERAAYLDAARASGLTIATLFVGYDGQSYQSMEDIERTVGLAILPLRPHRLRVTLDYSELASGLGVPSLTTHLGFFPKDVGHADYLSLVEDVRTVLDACARRGQTFHLETGQEPAAGLLEFIRRVGRPNLAVNFDPANFLLYGTGDPLAALDALATYVRGVHCKDAISSGVADRLGEEVPLGEGEVDFPAMLARLRAIGFRGPLVIERESGPDRLRDILAAREYLNRLIS